MEKLFKRSIAIFLCLIMVFNYSFSVLANENVESSEPETTYTKAIETTETTGEVIESESKTETEEKIEEEIIEEDISSPSEIIDEDGEEEDGIPTDTVEETEEDEVMDEPEEEPVLLGSVASPSDTEEVEEKTEEKIEEEFEEASPSELGKPTLLGTPLFGATPANECKIGSTEYATLGDALFAVTTGQTITILEDLTYNNNAPGFNMIGGFTIDFDGHSLTVATGMPPDSPTVTNIFSVGGLPENLTIKNATINITGMMYSGVIKPFTVSGDGVKLTLVNITQADNLSNFLTIDNGGTAIIDGGTFGTGNKNTKINLKNNATLKLTNNPTFNLQGNLIQIGDSSNSDTLMGNVTIDSGTFNGGAVTAGIVELNGKANVTINGGTFTCSGSNNAPIHIGSYGYKSNLTINNLSSDSLYVFKSNNNTDIGSFTATINNGHFKYTKGKFAIDSGNNLTPDIKLNGGFYGPDIANTDALVELNAFCVSGKQIQTLPNSDSEYVAGYRYKIAVGETPSPTPTPPSGGGGSNGGGSSSGSPVYDTSGNILRPGVKQSYNYDGTNPPNLTGDINVSSWNYATGIQQANNIQYVQNTDSFIRTDNTPVAIEWVGVTTNDIGKVMWYRTDAVGKILKNQFIQIGNNIYYLDNNGIMVTGQYTINGKVYNFDTTVGATEGKFLY